jgi:peptidoglycan/xylan/chitin deacetylase (PgdA/CDA1 family)
MDWLAPLEHALDAAPAPVELFFRDDDAGWADDRLLALLDLFDEHRLPLDVAVIPAALDRGLAAELRARADDRTGLHQHGYAHRNHEPKGRRHEFGPSRTHAAQRRDIEAGARRLADLLGDDVLDPIFTPPWNRCTRATGEALAELGFALLSRDSTAEPLEVAGLTEISTSVDWSFARRKGVRVTWAQLAELAAERVRADGIVGVNLHHGVMEEAELRFLDELLGLLAGHAAARCTLLSASATRR